MLFLFIFYTLLWLFVAGFEIKALFFGLLAVSCALLVHRLLNLYPPSINLFALVKFFFYFLLQSFLSGLDVAKRVLSPKLLVDPGFVVYNLNTNKQRVKLFLSMILNLTPGTLSVEIKENTILIHTLDKGGYNEERIRHMESLIDRIFS
ncbi:MAG: Na+/H+ antiporter subunit E [Aquificaceae bacterium]